MIKVAKFKKDGITFDTVDVEWIEVYQLANPILDDYDTNDENIDETGKGCQPKAVFYFETTTQ